MGPEIDRGPDPDQGVGDAVPSGGGTDGVPAVEVDNGTPSDLDPPPDAPEE